MPRRREDKRRKRADLRTLDTNSKAYWEEKLQRASLGMDAGKNTKRIVYVGNAMNLESISQENYGDRTGDVQHTHTED